MLSSSLRSIQLPRLFQTINKQSVIRHFSASSLQRSNLKRACLYVPGSDKKKIEKGLNSSADCVVIDCEDGVAMNRKKDARENIRELLSSTTNPHSSNLTVRVNSVQSEFFHDDVKCVLSAANKPKCLFIPKTDELDHIKKLYESINAVAPDNEFNFFFYTESAIGLLNLRDILQGAIKLSETKYNSKYRLEGVVFGSDDFCADIQATRTHKAEELLYVRQAFVTICKAFRLQAVDMVYIDYKDLNGLQAQSEEAARFGYTGKQVIHPGQIDIVQKAFSPSKQSVDWATRLIEAFQEHQKSGKGAFTFQGCMIDKPLLLQAKNILSMVSNTNSSKK